MAKRGRKVSLPWNKIKAFEWRNKSDREVAKKVGCSIPMANVKRRALKASLEERGKDPEFYTYRYGRKKAVA